MAAIGIAVLWLSGLAALERREMQRGPAQQVAEAALLVEPGAAYFRVTEGDAHVGFAASVIDTATAAITSSDVMVTIAPEGTAPHALRMDGRYSRGLRLHELTVQESDGTHDVTAHAAMMSDSLLHVVVTRGTAQRTVDTSTYIVTRPLLLPSMVPAILALGQRLHPGVSRRMLVFDPAAMRPRLVDVRVAAESLFVVADSARAVSSTGQWEPALTDTVRAWRVQAAGMPLLAGWIDAGGRVVELRPLHGTMRVTRTPYELAYLNWSDRAAVGLDALGVAPQQAPRRRAHRHTTTHLPRP